MSKGSTHFFAILMGLSVTFFFAGESTITVAYAADSQALAKSCASQRFINAAGLKLREKKNVNSKALAILNFNTSVCLLSKNIPLDEWAEISIGTTRDAKGWVHSKYLASAPTPRTELIAKMNEEIESGNYSEAQVWGERALEAEEPLKLGDIRELYKNLATVYRAQNDEIKVKKIESRLQTELNSRTPKIGDKEAFEPWFYEKFANSSAYHQLSDGDELSEAEVDLLVQVFVQQIPKDGETASPLQHHLRSTMAHLIFPAMARSSKRIKVSESSRKLLSDPVTAIYIAMENPYQLTELLSVEATNHPMFLERFLNKCHSGRMDENTINKLTAQNIRQYLAKILNCSNSGIFPAVVRKLPAAGAPSEVLRYLPELNSAVATDLFRGLPESTRNNDSVIKAFMDKKIDIYQSLSPANQQKAEIKLYSISTAGCFAALPPNSKDRSFVKSYISSTRSFQNECLRLIDPALLADFEIAVAAVLRDPSSIQKIAEPLRKDPRIWQAFIDTTKTNGVCGFQHMPDFFSSSMKLDTLKAARNCMFAFNIEEFEIPGVADELSKGPIASAVFFRMPKSLRENPKILKNLERDRYYQRDMEQLKSSITEASVLGVVKVFGLKGFSELTFKYFREYSHGEDEPSGPDIWRPTDLSPQFWLSAAKIAKTKNEACDEWDNIDQFQALFANKSNLPLIAKMKSISGCPLEFSGRVSNRSQDD